MNQSQLNPKQSAFCDEYISNGFNAYKAALKVGYSESYASKQSTVLTSNPLIQQRVSNVFGDVEKDLGVTFEWRVNVLKQIINDIIPNDGSEPKRSHYKTAIMAIGEINKMYGDYAPQKLFNMTVKATLDKLQDARKAYDEY